MTFSAIDAIFLSGLGFVCILLTKVLYKSSKKAILFSKDGLQIIGDSHIDCCYIPWEKLTYAYYTKNYKKHSFLLLSPNKLSPKEANRFANRGANLSKIYVDCVVVIYLDRLQDLMQIKKLISNGTIQVNTYWLLVSFRLAKNMSATATQSTITTTTLKN